MDKERWEWEERKKMNKEIWRCRTQFMKKGSAFFPSKILSFSSFFIQMQDMCQIKYPKAENKPPKKKPNLLFSQQPTSLSNAPNCQQFPIADLPPPWPYTSISTKVFRPGPNREVRLWKLRTGMKTGFLSIKNQIFS